MVRGLAGMMRQAPAVVLRRQAAGLRAWSGTRTRDLARIATPTLVIVAADDLLAPGGERVAAAIPGATSVIVPDAGHAVTLEAPAAVNAALVRHLG
jgi:pimeloyl-ACP methyl ester carboxylesterase